eukprot:TRINITY_DN90920_c0_g1_i1.p1 TRINITY_DN90920_c0_g1~~TRINITY_DN90920_c0_g1_i1.p1  ORF type:complete len:214 (-),score=46.50 TRINITY_DN90920_c0_g1_i1:40-651(-)
MALRAARLLLLATSALPAAAFVCPPETLQAAPANLQAGAKCGGTCNAHGSCAAGLECQQPPPHQPLLLGVQSAGVCAPPKLALGQEATRAASEAVRLLNAQSNSIWMLVPTVVVSAEEERQNDGTNYKLQLQVMPSTCRNDGKHAPDDHACKPQMLGEPQLYDLTVRFTDGKGESSKPHFVMLKQSLVRQDETRQLDPVPLTM